MDVLYMDLSNGLLIIEFFLAAIWLPHGQLWLLPREQPHSPDMFITVFLHSWPEGQGEPRGKVGSLSAAER